MDRLQWIVSLFVVYIGFMTEVLGNLSSEAEAREKIKVTIYNRKHPFETDNPAREKMFTFPDCLKSVIDVSELKNFTHQVNYTTVDDQDQDFYQQVWEPKKTFVLIHGFKGRANNKRMQEIRDAHLFMEDVNVVCVDWAPLAVGPFYTPAVKNVSVVAQWTADFIKEFLNRSASKLEDFHLIGFSLGAHVAGMAGAFFHTQTNRSLARITGLDPAQPLFSRYPIHRRLDKSDATFVSVIHTELVFLGFQAPLGHADFYPNGGNTPQPACLGGNRTLEPLHCSHLMAVCYYVESVYKPTSFPAERCDSWAEYVNTTGRNTSCAANQTTFMGAGADTSAEGSFYLRTRDAPPYGMLPTPELHHGHTLMNSSFNKTPQKPDTEAKPASTKEKLITFGVIYGIPLAIVVTGYFAYKGIKNVRLDAIPR